MVNNVAYHNRHRYKMISEGMCNSLDTSTSLPMHPILNTTRDKLSAGEEVYIYIMLALTMNKQYSHSTSSFIICKHVSPW